MKRSSDGGWAHVVCALYIPEVSFGDDTTMQPIILSKIPSTRFGQECSICIQNGRSKLVATSGACCSCTAKNCSQVFHVTCAQANGLLCEDVRKNNCQYPIYCEQHRPKLSVNKIFFCYLNFIFSFNRNLFVKFKLFNIHLMP